MTEELVMQLLQLARESGGEPEVSDDPEENLETAGNFLAFAREAYSSGIRDEHVIAIMRVGEELEKLLGEEDAGEPADESIDNDKKHAEVPAENDEKTEQTESWADQAYVARQEAVAEIRKKKLYAPSEPGDDLIEMPRDLTMLDDLRLRRLYSEQNALYVYTSWLVALEAADLDGVTRIADYKHDMKVRTVPTVDEDGKKKLSSIIEAEVSSDDEVQRWRVLQVKHATNLKLLRALMFGHQSNVDRISREFSMRDAGRGLAR